MRLNLKRKLEMLVIAFVLFLCGKLLISILSTSNSNKTLVETDTLYSNTFDKTLLAIKVNLKLDKHRSILEFNETRYVQGEPKNHENPYKRNSFNLTASDELRSDRQIPDIRQRKCLDQVYSESLPSTSVVICFHNEARSTLLRTVISVLNRSPPSLIHEIILVDDFSDDPNDGILLEALPKVKVLRNNAREGLVRSRITGADYATAPVLTFLDSHCECNVGWLEPLLQRVMEDSRVIVCPVIDTINHDTFKYTGYPPTSVGVFDWGLSFKWGALPGQFKHERKTEIDPLKTPTIAGGLFSINRQRFIDIGKYDEGMDIWGGENIEISFRTWMCGGSMEIIPCSRVGHVFRTSHPYKFPNGNSNTVMKNAKRTAEVWMDEYKEFFYSDNTFTRNKELGNIDERVALRKKLNCTSFDWYIKNIYPELSIPDHKNILFGQIFSRNKCLDRVSHSRGGSAVILPCQGHKEQVWLITTQKQIRSLKLCLEGNRKERTVQLQPCLPSRHENQQWEIIEKDKQIKHLSSGYCLSSSQGKINMALLEECNMKSLKQYWTSSLHKINALL